MELFNHTLGRIVAREIPAVRVFVGLQEGDAAESGAYAWTKCIEESKVFVVQVARRTLLMPAPKIQYAASHEACHLILHRGLLCNGVLGGGYAGLGDARRREIENEADQCAGPLAGNW